MEIIRHLSDDELMDLTIESDRQALRSMLESLPDWARTSTEQSEEFWQKQRQAVWSRISTPQFRAQDRLARWSPALVWSALAAIVVLAGLILDHAPATLPREAKVDPDHELLLQVERAVNNDGPAALDPAALLAEEMVQDVAAVHHPVRKKEPTHEN
jgi:hypothetical protein